MTLFGKAKIADPAAARQAMLASVPIRNTHVEEVRADSAAGGLRLKAPVRPTVVSRLFGSGARTKSFELDDLGAFVWSHVDGRATVERIITLFADKQRVNLRAAEVSVTAFLQMLLKRNLIALAVPEAARAARKEKRR